VRTWHLSYKMNLRLLGHWNGLQWPDLVVTEEHSRFAVGTSWTAKYWKPREGQGYNEIYPVWPRNDALPQLLLSKYCIHLHKYAVRQLWFIGQHMITFPGEYDDILFFISALHKIFWHHLSAGNSVQTCLAILTKCSFGSPTQNLGEVFSFWCNLAHCNGHINYGHKLTLTYFLSHDKLRWNLKHDTSNIRILLRAKFVLRPTLIKYLNILGWSLSIHLRESDFSEFCGDS